MAKSLSAALIASKNALESTSPWTFLYQITITGAGTFRVVNYDSDITFQGLTFTRFPVRLDSIAEGHAGNIATIRVTAGNVDQQIQSLLENYWASVADPEWTVDIWRIDATQPDETPLAASDTYEVVAVTTDFLAATFELRWAGMTMSRRIPGRRYVRTAGFPNIPRRIR